MNNKKVAEQLLKMAKELVSAVQLTDNGADLIKELNKYFKALGWEKDFSNLGSAIRAGSFRWRLDIVNETPNYKEFKDGWENWMTDRRRSQMLQKYNADDMDEVFQKMLRDNEAEKKKSTRQAKKAEKVALSKDMPRDYIKFGYYTGKRGDWVEFSIRMNNSLITYSEF